MSSPQSSLPLYYKKGRLGSTYGNGGATQRRFKEFHCLIFLLVSFLLAWLCITLYMPAVQHSDVSFQESYDKFSKPPLVDGDSGRLSPSFGSDILSQIEHFSISRGIESKENSSNRGVFDSSSRREQQPSAATVNEVNKASSSDITNNAEPEVPEERNNLDENAAINNQRRLKVKEMIKHAWDGYVEYAFGENELKPITKRGHSASVFGKTRMGATLVDSLDTLYIVGLTDEFNKASEWVKNHFHIDEVNTDVSLFEFNIRFVGGFLSAYALSGNEMFIDKAKKVVDKLLPAFNTPTGIPKSLINLKTGASKNWKWAAGGSSILSEVGSLHLEFQYLTEVTKNPIYLSKVMKIREKLRDMAKADGLYSNFMNGDTGRWTQKHISLGALGDSFYEYLIKEWLITSKKDTDGLDMFTKAVSTLEPHLLQKKKNGLVMVTDYRRGGGDGKMQHLACFSGGMFALASKHINSDQAQAQHYFDLAEGITGMCHESYTKSPTHLGPEAFRVDSEGSVIARQNEKMYLLRPETVESYFYMWRITHDPKYREWGWEMVEALELHCKVDYGYSGLKDVFRVPAVKDDVQQSFFIAETLKYLYLLFSDDSVMPLDEWVFNTEAHPLPVLSGIPSYT